MFEEKRTWKTASGEVLKISVMETSHIKNCIKYLERYKNNRLSNLMQMESFMTGEQALQHIDDQIECILDGRDDFEQDEVDEYIYSFEQELKRRS